MLLSEHTLLVHWCRTTDDGVLHQEDAFAVKSSVTHTCYSIQAPTQQAIPPPGVQGQYGPAPGSGYPPQGYPQPQNTGVNPQGGYPMTVIPSAWPA